MAHTLLPFRDYDEHDVINLFAVAGTADKGLVVMADATAGWKNTDELSNLGAVGATYANTVSDRFGSAATVKAATGTNANPIGMLLHDVKETDENGEKLIFNPRKAAEMNVSLSGQATPVVTRGIFLYSGSTLKTQTVTAGLALYHDDSGEITTGTTNTKIGKALGGVDDNDHVLIKLEL